jgi:hypothetical protein
VLYLLDVDPDLGQGIPAAEFEGARQHAIAPLLEVDGPHWNPGELPETTRSWLGLFVATGLLIRQTTLPVEPPPSCSELATSSVHGKTWTRMHLSPTRSTGWCSSQAA